MSCSRRRCSASAGAATQQTKNGLVVRSRISVKMRTSVSTCAVISCSQTMPTCTFGSSIKATTDSRNSSGRATNSPVTSTGLPAAPKAGITEASRACVAGLSVGTARPTSSARSAIMTPAPPDCVAMPRPLPSAMRSPASASSMSSICSSLRARSTPNWRMTASNTVSVTASAPVCDAAARTPEAMRPTLVSTSGFFSS